MTETISKLGPEVAQQIWAKLAEEGKSPSELTFAGQVLPAYSVGINTWIARLTSTYLQRLSRTDAHFKLVIAPYGGGKTHFLMAMGSEALQEGFAVAYIGCTQGVDFDNAIELYRAFIKSLQLPNEERPGIVRLLRRVIDHKIEQIRNAAAPDPEEALEAWVKSVARDDYPESAFGRVMAEALMGEYDPARSVAGDAALRWLRGEFDTLTKDEMAALRLAKVPNKARNLMGRNLLLTMFRFVREAGVNGAVVLFDEVETMFTARGKALQRVLSAMRVMLDVPDTVPGGVPLLGLFSTVPDVLEQLPKYKALEQRMAVKGASFEEGNDYATQLHLERLQSQEELLRSIGLRLIELGELATGHYFDRSVQEINVTRLAEVAAERNLEVDARRLYVKSCTNILDLQVHQGEREFLEEEITMRYQGFFDGLKNSEQSESEP